MVHEHAASPSHRRAQPPETPWMGWLSLALGDAVALGLLGLAARRHPSQRQRLALAASAVVGITALDVWMHRRSAARKPDATARQGAVSVSEFITVNVPPTQAYALWRDFARLPDFMAHLRSVTAIDARRSHWVVDAPAGLSVAWDAEITEDKPNQLIAWRSLPGADVTTCGAVRFAQAPGGRGTEIGVELQYSPPAGRLGAAFAKLFGEAPHQQIRADLRRFKQVLEVGHVVQARRCR